MRLSNKNVLLISFLFFLLILNCKDIKKDKTINKNTCVKCVEEWKKDSCGCLKIRSVNLFKNIFTDYDLLNKNRNNIVSLIGNPNEKETHLRNGEKFETFYYYINVICINGKPIQDSDKCYVQLNFKNDTLKAILYPCE